MKNELLVSISLQLLSQVLHTGKTRKMRNLLLTLAMCPLLQAGQLKARFNMVALRKLTFRLLYKTVSFHFEDH